MFSITKSITNRNITRFIYSIEEWVDYLKNEERKEVSTIKKLRNLKKGEDEYDKIKKTLPTIFYNYNFKENYVKESNADVSTGFLFFDIDDNDFCDFDYKYISVCWRSVGGNGYGLLVKVKNLNKDFFKESYNYIGTEILKIPFDKACNHLARANFISYDKDVIYNPNSEIIDLTQFNSNQNKNAQNNNIIKSNTDRIYCYGQKIRFNNLSDIIAGQNIVYNEKGVFDFGKNNKINYCECYAPKKRTNKNRNTKTFAFAKCILSVNPSISENLFKHYINNFNSKYCSPPMSFIEITDIINKVYNDKKTTPIGNKTKRFLFEHREKLSKSEKSKLYSPLLGKERREKTISKIVEIIKNWDYEKYPKLNKANVFKVRGKGRESIRNYFDIALSIAKKPT